MWDVERAMEAVAAGATGSAAGGGKVTMPAGATVVPGHYGGTVSQLRASYSSSLGLSSRLLTALLVRSPADVDPTCRWMFTTSGNRAWEGTSTENLVIHEIKAGRRGLE